jgi:hypothetical protein
MGKPYAPFDVAGAGDGRTVGLVRHSQRKRGATARPDLRCTAPALDPTCVQKKADVFSRSQSCQGNNRKPRSWDGRQEGNRMS